MAATQRSSRGGRNRRMMNEINVVPYIDVMLVLLIIFMVAAPMINPGTVDLPSVAKSSAPPAMPIEVTIQADGTLSLRVRGKEGISERTLSKTDLPAQVANLQRDNPERAVVLAADKSVRYELVMQTLSSLQKFNVQKVGLLVNPETATTISPQ
jgi:biopolymer transport protein TolR